MKDKDDLNNIAERINDIFRKNTEPIILQININNKGNRDYNNVGLLSLFVVSRDLFKNSIKSLKKCDYYTTNILIRKVFENSLVFIRLYDNNKLKEYFQLCEDLKSNDSSFDKDTQKCKNCKFRDLANIAESRKHFAKINQNISKQNLDLRYKVMCEYTHFNRIKIGQYKHHLKNFNMKKIDVWSYDLKTHNETLVNIILAFENLIFAVEHVCKSKNGYNKKLFDNIYQLVEKNRNEYKNVIPTQIN